MSNRIHALAQQLAGKPTIEDCSLEEIRHIVKRYPYFASAQFLLLQKLQQLNSPEAEEQHKKAVLFYHDPLLFDYFISSDKFYTEEKNLFENGPGASVLTETLPANFADSPNGESDQQLAIEEANEEKMYPVLAETSDEKAFVAADILPAEKMEVSIEETLPELSINPSLPTLKTPDVKSDTVPEAALAFEPYHTVDYFASQGIKITTDEAPKDKLGKQLKSFTEWLKTMKRLPQAEAAANMEPSAEKKIETMAGNSVSESNVETEAMAEVWVKQGNTEKAKEIYNKLSLLNPSKRAYFAAKIDNLK